jgi:hypothetical protein
MEPSKAAMKAALRVLTALGEHQEPDQADVDELQWYAPADRERPLDELACDAIQLALKDREHRRKAVQMQLRERVLALTAGPQTVSLGSHPPGRDDREADGRRQYLALTAKLQRLGAVFQATANIMANDAGSYSANSEAAMEVLESVAGDVDISGTTQLLNEHARLARNLISGEPKHKKHGTE